MDGYKASGLMEVANSLTIAVTQGLMNREHAKQVWNKTLDLAGINTPKPVVQPKPVKSEVKKEPVVESPKTGE